ncbi:MAG: hypothetical protein LBV51_01940 [Acholeplasmatales bacterium]|jgi:hypothetical protein|nr:hypothetical protein [Acholeplasmatales bacterium]
MENTKKEVVITKEEAELIQEFGEFITEEEALEQGLDTAEETIELIVKE